MNEKQTRLHLRLNRRLEFSDEEINCLQYLAEELEEWRKLKNTKA